MSTSDTPEAELGAALEALDPAMLRQLLGAVSYDESGRGALEGLIEALEEPDPARRRERVEALSEALAESPEVALAIARAATAGAAPVMQSADQALGELEGRVREMEAARAALERMAADTEGLSEEEAGRIQEAARTLRSALGSTDLGQLLGDARALQGHMEALRRADRLDAKAIDALGRKLAAAAELMQTRAEAARYAPDARQLIESWGAVASDATPVKALLQATLMELEPAEAHSHLDVLQAYERALELALDQADVAVARRAALRLNAVAVAGGAWDVVDEVATRVMALAEEEGAARDALTMQLQRALARARLERWEEADGDARAVVRGARDLGLNELYLRGLLTQGEIAELEGDANVARLCYGDALLAARKADQPGVGARAMVGLARTDTAGAADPRAGEYLRAAAKVAVETGDLVFYGTVALALCEHHEEAGRRVEAVGALVEARSQLLSAGLDGWTGILEDRLGELEARWGPEAVREALLELRARISAPG